MVDLCENFTNDSYVICEMSCPGYNDLFEKKYMHCKIRMNNTI